MTAVFTDPLTTAEFTRPRDDRELAGQPEQPAPLALQALVTVPAEKTAVPDYRYDPKRQVAVDLAGQSLRMGKKGKDWTSYDSTHTADAVVEQLAARNVPMFRTDLADFPTRLGFHAELNDGRWRGRLWNEHREAELDQVRSIWHRQPSTYRFPDGLSEQHKDFAYREAKLGFGGVLASMDVLWVNHPNRRADAIYKPLQWRTVAECGLDVADTVITNDPAAAAGFAAAGPTITKALGPTGIVDDGTESVSFTREITSRDDLEGVRATATTLQRFVPKDHEVRLTVIGDRWFPIAIHADSDAAHVDWRSDPQALSYRPVPVPNDVVNGVAAYMKRMQLVVAAFDFVVTPGGYWTMLEFTDLPLACA